MSARPGQDQPEPGAIYVMDRGYVDFARLYALHLTGAFFVTRAKDNLACKRLYSNKADKAAGIKCDQVIRLSSARAGKKYPDKLRRVKYFDAETNHYYVFLTNDFNVTAKTIADLFRYRRIIGINVALEGLREALRKREATPAQIARYASDARVWKIMEPYVSALTSDG